MSAKFSFFVAITLGIGLVGCTPAGEKTYNVSGQIIFDGEPVPDGEVLFRDAAGKASNWSGLIENGRYAFESTPGKKRVEISAFGAEEIQAESESGEPEFDIKWSIPEKYNLDSELTCTVTEDGPNEFDFNLEP